MLRTAFYRLGQTHALRKLALERQMSEGGYTSEEAAKLLPHAAPPEARSGLNEELEHKNITHGSDKLTTEIVKAHLREDPHYYEKIKAALK